MLSNRSIIVLACVAVVALTLVTTGCGERSGSPFQPSSSLPGPTVSVPSSQGPLVSWNCFRLAQMPGTPSPGTTGSPNTLVFHQSQESCESPLRVTPARSDANRIAALAVPGLPSNLNFLIIGTTVALRWSAPTTGDPPTSYVIEAGSAPGTANIAVFDTRSPATSLDVADVPSGTYYVRVRARNASGTSAQTSNEVLIVVGGSASCTPALLPPSGFTISVSGSSVVLTWTAPSGGNLPTSYVLEAGSSTGATNVLFFDTGNAATTIAGTAGPGNYYVRVRSKNACGTSAASNEVVVTIGAISCSYRLDTPSSFTFSNSGGTGDITLTTNAPCRWWADISAFTEDYVSVSSIPIQGSGTRTFAVRSSTLAPQPPLPRSGPVFVYELGSNLRLFSITIAQNP